MCMVVIKRDGKLVDYDLNKIRVAVEKANKETNELSDEAISKIISEVNAACAEIQENLEVERIQDLVETALMKNKYYATAKNYILYRDMRTRNRDNKSKLLKAVAKKLNASNIVNQNANVDEASFGGRKGEADSELMRWFALNNCMSKMSRENHLNNEIYIHDLDSYAVGMHNCLSIPFDQLLAEGFNTRQTDIRPAGSISTAFQLLAVIFQLQSLQQFGGVSATHLDWTMVPYVRKSFFKHYKDAMLWVEDEGMYYRDFCREENEGIYTNQLPVDDPLYKKYDQAYLYATAMTERELAQAVEGMYHNLNTLQSRSGNQLPFTSINYGTCTSTEGRMVIKALLEGSLAGIGKVHRTPIFPCGIFQYMKGVNDKPGTPNYDMFQLALKSTSKRLYPNYANCSWSLQKSWEVADMDVRRSVIETLSKDDYNKLCIAIHENPKIGEILGLEVTEGDDV